MAQAELAKLRQVRVELEAVPRASRALSPEPQPQTHLPSFVKFGSLALARGPLCPGFWLAIVRREDVSFEVLGCPFCQAQGALKKLSEDELVALDTAWPSV